MSLISNASVATVARSTVLFAGGNRQGYSDGAAIGSKFSFPQGVAIYKRITIICDTSNHVIRTIDEYGATKTLAGLNGVPGDKDGVGTDARFNLPHAVCVDSKGNAFVTDHGQLVRHITPDGVVTTLWDANKITAAAAGDEKSNSLLRTCSLRGICVTHDTAYMTCTATHSVISLSLVTKTARIVAGGNGAGYRDGKALGEAQFHSPHGIDADDDGHLYISDTTNHSIRKLALGGRVTTFAGTPPPDDGGPLPPGGLRDGIALKAQFAKPYGLHLDRLPIKSRAASVVSGTPAAAGEQPAEFAIFVCDGPPNKAIRRIFEGDVRTVAHLDFEPYDLVADEDHNIIINAPWTHNFHKLNLDEKGLLRASMDGSNHGASTNASRAATTTTGGSAAAAAAAAPIETRITFNFGDAKLDDTKAPIPGMKFDRELSLTPSTPRALAIGESRQSTLAPGSGGDGKPPLNREESTDSQTPAPAPDGGTMTPSANSKSPFLAAQKVDGTTNTTATPNAAANPDDKQCRMCSTGCAVM